MEHARKQQVPKETITSSDTVALEEFDQKPTLFNTMTKSKSFNKSPKHRALYHALMESILENEDALDKGVADELKKRKPDDADKDEDSNNTEYDDADYADMPMDQREDLGNTDEQPNNEVVPKNDWYKKSRNDTSPDPEWNEGKLVDDGPEQSWLNDMAKATKPPLTFDELMHTLIDFSTFAMNRLKIDNLTKEIFIGPSYNLLKGTCKSYVEPAYTTLSNPQGVIYEEKLKRKRFMRADELHKFSDGTLILVRHTLSQMLHELHLWYNKAMRRSNILRVLRIILVILPEHQSDTKVFTMTMEILPEPTSNKLCGSTKVTTTQDGKRSQDNDSRLCLADDLKEAQVHMQVKLKGPSSSLKSKDHYAYHKLKDKDSRPRAKTKDIRRM
ncbi:hypothetical protein Tco_0837924 [Tanacetum coccineum]